MVQSSAQNIALIAFLSIIFNSVYTKNFCQLKSGNIGVCLEPEECLTKLEEPLTNCTEVSSPTSVCCTAMERIVTPNNAAVPPSQPVIPQPIEPVYTVGPFPVPIVEVTTKTSTPTASPGSIASAKCEEYKHRVKKRASIMTYVFGGIESLSKEFPHMAALGYGQPNAVEWLCGGSLISEQFVATAAHCLLTTSLGPLVRVRLGDLDLQSDLDDASPQDFGVAAQYIYPSYHLPVQYNDIALLQLDRPVAFSAYIAPICLQTSAQLPAAELVASGWGRTELGGLQSDVLMKVALEYFPNDACRQNYLTVSPESLPSGINQASQICAGSRTDERDTCQGDSGGPLQIKEGDAYYLVGITSFGKACGVPNSPAVYTRVSYFVPWIEQIVWG